MNRPLLFYILCIVTLGTISFDADGNVDTGFSLKVIQNGTGVLVN